MSEDITQEFDGPVIEPVKGFGDVKFARADMDYWAAWAAALKLKRLQQLRGEIDKMMGLNPLAKAEAMARAQNANVQLFEVLDLQYTPEGIKKLLADGYQRGGGDVAKWPDIAKRIAPSRQQAIASDICSEPKPTVDELRDSLRDLLRKAGKNAAGVEGMGDEELIRAVKEFTPAEPSAEKAGESPLSETPESESVTGSTCAAADTSFAMSST